MKIVGNKKIEFTAQGIAFVLDMLAEKPFKDVHQIIGDIMGQLTAQEGVSGTGSDRPY